MTAIRASESLHSGEAYWQEFDSAQPDQTPSNPRVLSPDGHDPETSKNGAGEGNRTLVCSLEGCRSTIELHPRDAK